MAIQYQRYADGAWHDVTVLLAPPGNYEPSGAVAAHESDYDHDRFVATADTNPAINEVLKWNGSAAVWVPEGTSFSFSIASFSDGQSSPQLIGQGVWMASGSLSFTASYNNGPPASAVVSVDGNRWGAGVTADIADGSAISPAATNYPSVGGAITFTLTANGQTSTQGVTFYNYLRYGVTTKLSTDTWLESDIEALSAILSDDNTRTWPSVTAGSGERIVLAWPSRLATPLFFIGGFELTFDQVAATISVTNAAGYSELYRVFLSSQANLGATIVVTS